MFVKVTNLNFSTVVIVYMKSLCPIWAKNKKFCSENSIFSVINGTWIFYWHSRATFISVLQIDLALLLGIFKKGGSWGGFKVSSKKSWWLMGSFIGVRQEIFTPDCQSSQLALESGGESNYDFCARGHSWWIIWVHSHIKSLLSSAI